MALTKQNLAINFSNGVETKTDPFQIPVGKFAALSNIIFDKDGLLQKRNGFGQLGSLPDSSSTFLTTLNDNLTAVGTSLQAYSPATNSWITRGSFQPVRLSTLPLVRSAINQSYADVAIASNGLICTVFQDDTPSGGSTTPTYKYVIANSSTGQNIIAPTAITPSAGAVTYTPKVFLLGKYFVIIFNTVITAVDHLEFIAINTADPTAVTAASDITGASYTAASTGTFDAVTMNNRLYIAWNGNDMGGAIRVTFLSAALQQSATTTAISGYAATQLSLGADEANSTVYLAFNDTNAGHVAIIDGNLNLRVGTPTSIYSATAVSNITVAAQNQIATVFYEVANNYSYDSGVASNFVKKRTVTQAGVAGTASTILRSVGLASKAFICSGSIYVLTTYSSTYQPTYFLIDDSGHAICKLAYQNGGGYLTKSLPNVAIDGTTAKIPYLIKDLIQSVNKDTNIAAGTQTAGIYSQTGINLANFEISTSDIQSSEIADCLNLTGGFLWMYDGLSPVENNFFLYPDSIEATWSATGGSIAAKPDGTTTVDAYYYQVTYEWSDNNGNVYRSAPSIPIPVTTSGAGTSGSIAVHVPTLRITYKTTNPVTIHIYRWSVAQQAYYQVTSLSAPVLNSTSSDSITFTDTLADATILGNELLYTTGGVLENVSTPAASAVSLFQSRLFMIDAEDPNLLWYSKQVIENTPVEMSDQLTIFVSPTSAAQGSTGPMRVLAPMDDKLIIFKDNALYYLNGTGPDNTGSNNQFSEPTFIASTVGCNNAQSIVFIPSGLMFQSDKGIWLLSRDLSTKYIGSPVDAYKTATVTSAVNIPGTNQVRFTLDTGIALVYDYFYDRWATFSNVSAVSSCLYNSLHTYINATGLVYQETPGAYLDGTTAVTMSFTTSWFNLTGLQGYERAYFFYILGTYITPHKINLSISYDYSPTASQTVLISPDNFNSTFGNNDGLFGSENFGGNPSLEQWRIFFQTQKCQAFQIAMQELYDPTMSTQAGAGFTLSGFNLVVGAKKTYRAIRAANSVG